MQSESRLISTGFWRCAASHKHGRLQECIKGWEGQPYNPMHSTGAVFNVAAANAHTSGCVACCLGGSVHSKTLNPENLPIWPVQSFNVGVAGDRLVLPTDCLERWFKKFDAKYKRDPDFLLSNLGDG